jgi:hypothetical protein
MYISYSMYLSYQLIEAFPMSLRYSIKESYFFVGGIHTPPTIPNPSLACLIHSSVRSSIMEQTSGSRAAVLSEAALVVKAAKKQRMTISNFVASAALKEAEVVNYKPGKRQ